MGAKKKKGDHWIGIGGVQDPTGQDLSTSKARDGVRGRGIYVSPGCVWGQVSKATSGKERWACTGIC